jgi:hypothetical protein
VNERRTLASTRLPLSTLAQEVIAATPRVERVVAAAPYIEPLIDHQTATRRERASPPKRLR